MNGKTCTVSGRKVFTADATEARRLHDESISTICDTEYGKARTAELLQNPSYYFMFPILICLHRKQNIRKLLAARFRPEGTIFYHRPNCTQLRESLYKHFVNMERSQAYKELRKLLITSSRPEKEVTSNELD